MRAIKYIVLHCTAGPQTQTIQAIKDYWKAPKPKGCGWKSPGYHYIIEPDGDAVSLLPIEQVSNGVAGHNANSIHISYIGGANGVDNRTPAQKATQIRLVKELKAKFPHAEIKGHRDFPGVKKLCPSFDVKTWLKAVNLG